MIYALTLILLSADRPWSEGLPAQVDVIYGTNYGTFVQAGPRFEIVGNDWTARGDRRPDGLYAVKWLHNGHQRGTGLYALDDNGNLFGVWGFDGSTFDDPMPIPDYIRKK